MRINVFRAIAIGGIVSLGTVLPRVSVAAVVPPTTATVAADGGVPALAVPRPATGPTLAAERAGVTAAAAVTTGTNDAVHAPAAAAVSVSTADISTGKNPALMIVGAVAIGAGALIGGGAGAAVAIGGAAVGLYGLYQFLK